MTAIQGRGVAALLLGLAVLCAHAAAEQAGAPLRVARAESSASVLPALEMPSAAAGSRQRTHLLGADPGMAALLEQLGAAKRFGRIAREQAMAAYDQSGYEAAVPLLYTAHVLQPRDPDLLRFLGFAAKSTGRYELACDALERAAIDTPNEYTVWWWLGDAQRLLGHYEESVESMERARGLAPEEEQVDLGGYVDYSVRLADPAPSWEHFDYHRDFANRHRAHRRARRLVAELQAALDRVPEFDPGDTEAWARLGWVCSEIGYQYMFLMDYETALLYFERAVRHYRRIGSAAETARNLNNAADAFAARAECDWPRHAHWLRQAVRHRQDAYAIARGLPDPAQQRYTLGRYIEDLAWSVPPGDPKLVELRAVASRELPRQGDIEDYSMAAVAQGEAVCRLAAGDYGGARQLLEKVLPHIDASEFLEDTIRAARTRALLAHIYSEQGQMQTAIAYGVEAVETLDRVRTFIHADAFALSPAIPILRLAGCSVLRAAIGNGDWEFAVRIAEDLKQRVEHALLGGAIADELHFSDFALEAALTRARIPEIEIELSRARADGRNEDAASLRAHLGHARGRLEALLLPVSYARTAQLNFEFMPQRVSTEIQAALPDGAMFVSFAVGRFGACQLVITPETIDGAYLPDADETTLTVLAGEVRKALAEGVDPAPLLDDLGERLGLAGLGAPPLLFVSPDDPLFDLPMDLARTGGRFLFEDSAVAHVLGGAHLVHALALPPAGEAPPLWCTAAEGCAETDLRAPGAPHGALYLEAPAHVRMDSLINSALLLRGGAGADGRLSFAELLAHPLPARVAGVCLGDGWPGDAPPGLPMRVFAQAMAYADVAAFTANTGHAPCPVLRALVEAEGLDAGALAVLKRDGLEQGRPPAEWAPWAFYGARN